MRKPALLFVLMLISLITFSQTQIYFDDFESYTVPGQLACQNPDWNTWNNNPCSNEDADIINTYSHNGSQSAKITVVGGTDNDIVFVTKNLPNGKYKIGFYMYIPSGKVGYFNTLQVFDPVASNYEWGMQIYFNAGGSAQLDGGAENAATFTFSFDTWFYNEVFVDLDVDYAEYYFNNTLIHGWQWSTGWNGGNNLNQLEGNDLFAWGGNDAEYYVDDYNFIGLNPPENLIAATIGNNINLSWDTPSSKTLLGYNIYRDGTKINASPVTETYYTDADMSPGSYQYSVTTVYDDGAEDPDESGPSNNVVVTIDFYDFENATAGTDQVGCFYGVPWTTWDNNPCTATDANIVATQAYSGTNCAEVAGTTDLVYDINNYTSGKHKIELYMYNPTGYLGYFNILQEFAGAGSSWGMQVFFDTGATASVDAGGESAATFTYSYDNWNYNEVFVDLDMDYAEYYFNGNLIVSWVWSTGTFGGNSLNQLGGANMYAWDDEGAGTPLYYFDDYGFFELTPPQNLNFSLNQNNVNLSWDAPAASTLTLLGYDVYRDGSKINTSLITSTSYNDLGLSQGAYEYYVIAIYDDGPENNDESGPSNTITITMGVQTALNFSQNIFGSYKETVTVPGIDVAGNTTISVEAWCLLGQYLNPINQIVVKETTVPPCGYEYLAFNLFTDNTDINNQGLASFGIGDGTTFYSIASTISLPLGEWHHIAGTYDGTTLRVFVDGIEQGSAAVAVSLYDAGIEMNIGNRWNCARRYFDGDIDEVRIWNDARTEQEIRENMHRELPNPAGETDLIAYYRFNEGTGTIAYDSGPNSYNGQLGGYSFSGNTTSSPTWITSTAPIPYYSVADGNWDTDNTWDAGQMAPVNNWSRAIINHDVHLNQSQALMDLVINSGSILTIDAGYDLTMDGDIQNYAGNDGFIIKADAGGMGSLIHSNSNVNATVEEYITSERWHLISSPVSNSTISLYQDIYLKKFIEPTNSWTYLVNPTSLPMNVGQGYSAWPSNSYTGTTTVNFSGSLNTGDHSITNLSYTPISSATGWNLIGNPYPSSLQWNNTWTKTDIGDWACVHNNGNDECYDAATGTSWPNVGDMANGIIPSTQGFWVRATSATASLTIPQSERTHSNQSFYKDSFVEIENAVRLRVDGNNDFDVVLVQFTPEATEGFDARFDLEKRWGYNESPQLYAIKDDGFYSVDVLPEITDDLVIPVGFEVGIPGLYTLTVTEILGFSKDIPVTLEDIKENTFTELSLNSTYQCIADPADNNHRFNLRFKDTAFDIDDNNIPGLNIFSNEDMIFVRTPDNFNGDIIVYDILGKAIAGSKATGEGLTSIKINSGTGYYLVKLQTGKQLITQKVFLK